MAHKGLDRTEIALSTSLARLEPRLYKETIGQAIPFLVESFSRAWSNFLIELIPDAVDSNSGLIIGINEDRAIASSIGYRTTPVNEWPVRGLRFCLRNRSHRGASEPEQIIPIGNPISSMFQ